MSRYKFRAWNKRLKKMYEVYEINFEHGLVKCKSDSGSTHTFGMIDIDLMQWSGLLDKNGKEIYEGDKLKSIDSVGVIKLGEYIVYDMQDCGEQNVLGWYIDEINDRSDGSTYESKTNLSSERLYAYEVIGHLHEGVKK